MENQSLRLEEKLGNRKNNTWIQLEIGITVKPIYI